MSSLPSISYEAAIKLLRTKIIDQTGLPSERVLNAYSFYGPDILKTISQTTGQAPTLQDGFIIFEFKEVESEVYGITKHDDGQMTVITPYGLFCKIYGEQCHLYAQQLMAIFKYPSVAEELRNSGCHITDISNIVSANEFINNILWPRCDLEIQVTCNIIIDIAKSIVDEYDSYAETLTNIIIEKGD